jgi:hypothetical protein
VLHFSLISGYKNIMVPKAESFRRTIGKELLGRRARARLTFFSFVATATLSASTIAFASGFSLEDDSALIVGSDSVMYSLDLSTGVATAGATLTGDSLTASFTALEADPTSDTAYVGTLGDASLSSIDTSDGITIFIEDNYGFMSGAGVDGIVRFDDGVTYLSHIQPMGAGYAISQVDLATGTLSSTQLTTLSSTNTRVTALAHVDDSIYAFVPGSTDTLYRLDPATGVLTEERAASGVVTGGDIVAADSTASGVLYVLAYDAGTKASALYSLDPASGGSTTSVAQITGLAAGKTAENLAIATLLDSERPADPEPAPSSDSEPDRDEEDVVEQASAPPLPVFKPPTKTLPEVQPEPDDTPTVSEPEPEIVEEEQVAPSPQVAAPVQLEEPGGGDGSSLALIALAALGLVLATVLLIALRARALRR